MNTYEDIKDKLIFFNKASKDYDALRNAKTEFEQEQAGFISGHLYETHEYLKYALSNSKENFEIITKFLEEVCPNTFSIMIANLDSNPDKYETLYDLCKDINVKKEDNFDFPVDCLQKITIYK